MMTGIGASKGFGIGKIVMIQDVDLVIHDTPVSDPEAELTRFSQAVDTFVHRTEKMAAEIRTRVGEKEAEILEGHIIMLQDPAMSDGVADGIKEGLTAERAFSNVCDMFIGVFSMAEDELTKQRATDVEDIRSRMLKILLHVEEVDIRNVPPHTILVAKDLTPSMTVGISKENVVGILTEVGGYTSHSAILARALGIPAVLSLADITTKAKDGMEAVCDGESGTVILSPTDAEKKDYEEKRLAYLEQMKALKEFFGKPTLTADNTSVELVCNIGKPGDATAVLEASGEGVGLFRTEFLFMDRDTIPTEEEQFQAYKEVAEKLSGKPVIIRTLDVGGDKEIPYLHLPKEDNPFLGYRAIRVCLDQKDMYRIQLRALLRASAYGKIRIMIPMITCIEELRGAKDLLEELKEELRSQSISFDENIPVGVMIETPAAVMIADLLAKEADFFSIGTNDLTQYIMAVDRGNAHVANLYSHYNPAVLRAIKHVIACGKKEGIMVGMCGEAAADSRLIPLLLSYGLQEFSVSATSVLATRATISKWDKASADALAKEVAALLTKEEVESCLKKNVR
ncbi:MAG: phosphoenolpyruvate--protein phosphotransferase [Lachnospiraceae bacterium]|nr:phosphoenolpyruvate--protein phosphotransferase [Lachnospiraceae bacterium]